MDSGVLPFFVSANTAAAPRSVTLQFVGDFSASFTITQEGVQSARPSILSISPTRDSAFTQPFSLQIFDAAGYRNIAGVTLVFDTLPATGACSAKFFQSDGQSWITLLSDDGSSYLPATLLPGSGTVSNSRCQISAASSSFTGSAQKATLTMGITFASTFTGDKVVLASATDAGNSAAPLAEVGQWTVGPPNVLHTSILNPLYFTYGPGAPTGSQGVDFSMGVDVPLTATTSVATGGNWLSALPHPINWEPRLEVNADPTGLPQGTYTGTVAVSTPGAPPVTLPVSMAVTPPPILAASPTSVAFSVPFFCPSPAPVHVAITSSSGPTPITAYLQTGYGINIPITASLDQNVTPAVLTISTDTTGAQFISYGGATVVISTPGQAILRVPVSIQVNAPPPPFLFLRPFAITLGVTPGNMQSQTATASAYACFGPTTFTTTVNTYPPGTWLSASLSGVTPGPYMNTTTLTVTANAAGLAPATYNGAVEVTDGHLSGGPSSLTLTVYPQPQFTVVPVSLNFTHQFQASAPAPQTIQVATPGVAGSNAALPFIVAINQGTNTAQCGPSWLVATPTAGTTTGTAFGVPVVVSYNPSGLAAGSYVCNGQLTVSLPGTAIGPITVPVALKVVTGSSAIQVSNLSPFNVVQGGAAFPASQMVTVSSASNAPFTMAASVPWLSGLPASGTANGAPIEVWPVNNLAPGTYNGQVTVTSAVSNIPVAVPVVLNVAAPTYSATPGSPRFTTVSPNPPPMQVSFVSNGVQLPITLVSAPSWLSVAFNGQSAVLTASITGLTPQMYVGNAVFSIPGASNSTFSLPVTLNYQSVAPCPTSLTPPSVNLGPFGTSTNGFAPHAPLNFLPTGCSGFDYYVSDRWVSIVGPSYGSANSPVSYTVSSNPRTTPRSATIGLAGYTSQNAAFFITQGGSTEPLLNRQVRAMYEQLLGREPDQDGFLFWTGAGSAALGQVVDAFLTSPEGQTTPFQVIAMYRAATGIPPLYSQFVASTAALRAGTQSSSQWFSSLVGTIVDKGSFVNALYGNLLGRAPTSAELMLLGRDADSAGASFWLGVANAAGPGIYFNNPGARLAIEGPGRPGVGFVGSPEFQGLFQ